MKVSLNVNNIHSSKSVAFNFWWVLRGGLCCTMALPKPSQTSSIGLGSGHLGPVHMANVLFCKKIINNASSVWFCIIVYKHGIWAHSTPEQPHIHLKDRISNAWRPVMYVQRESLIVVELKTSVLDTTGMATFFSVMSQNYPCRVILIESSSRENLELAIIPVM